MIRHLVATDLRRFRWTLTGWIALTAVYAALLYVTPAYVGDPARYNTLTTAVLLLFLVTHLAPLVLVPLIVQADAPVGNDAFWATRPIPPRAMLLAKAILLAFLIVILPALLELAAMIASRVPSSETVRITLATVLAAVMWLTLLMAASAVTASYPKFALLCASVVVAFAVALIVMEAVIRSRMEGAAFAVMSVGATPVSANADDGTSFVVFALGLIVSGWVFLIVQYRRRQRTVSVPAGAGAVALAFAAASVWPWALLQSHARLPPWTETTPRITVASPVAPFDPSPVMASRADAWRIGRLAVRVGGIPPGWFATVAMREATLTLPDGAIIRSRNRGFSASPAPEDVNEPPQRVALRQLLSVARLVDRYPPRGENVVAMVLSPEEYQRLASTTAAYRGTFVIDLAHVEIAGTVPLSSTAVFDGGVYQLRLRDVRYAAARTVMFSGMETRATSLFDRGPRELYSVFAVNRTRSEAVEGWTTAMAVVGDLAGFGVHASVESGDGFTRRGVSVGFPIQNQERVDVSLDENWLKQAELVVVRTTTVGHVVRTLEVPRLTVCTSPNGQC